MTTDSPFDLFDLTGKVAVVTGGSRGIGRSIVLGYARAGADVVIASRKLDNCEAVAREVEETTGRRALAVSAHVGHWDECDALVDTVYRELGHCEVLVNNAGMSPLYPDLASITEDYYDKVAAVNLKGPFRLATQFGSRMAADDGGSIINVSTIGSLRASGLELVYGCAKAGLNALTIGLADSYGPKVRANCILPGAVLTDIAEAWSPETRAGVGNLTPLKRAGVADDFIGTALWLASDASSYVTGVLVRVDGGMYRQT
jgi:NAD(P)-dependent dehydrogenase (short-subunit alcohol dehydrogenase family)